MRLVNTSSGAGLIVGEQVFDISVLSGGRLPSEPMRLVADHWDELDRLAREGSYHGGKPLAAVKLGSPVPRPTMIFSVVANFPPRERPEFPMVVGKSPSSISGPFDDIALPDPSRLPLQRAWVIPEPELAVVIGRGGRHLPVDKAFEAIAGCTIAQDITERAHEFGPATSPWTWQNLPAKTLGKSIDTFCPIGPAIVTPDEFADPNNLLVRCWINDQLHFEHSTASMLWSAAELVSLLSAFMTLTPGMICLCGSGGTKDGTPVPFLEPGDVVRTEIEGIGTMINCCASETAPTTTT